MQTTKYGRRRAAPRLLPGRRESPRSCRRTNIPCPLSDSDPRMEAQRSISGHRPPRGVDCRSSDIGSLVNVGKLIDGATLHSHAKLKAGELPDCFAQLQSATYWRIRAGEER